MSARAGRFEGMTAAQRAFADYYIACGNATDAYGLAYPKASRKNAKSDGFNLVKHPAVARYLLKAMAKRRDEAEYTANDVLQHWVDVVTADVRDVITVVRRCCRYCWGEEHQYQYTRNEWRSLVMAAALSKGKASAPDPLGGADFNGTKAPHSKCTECFGEGIAVPQVRDLQHLDDKTARLVVGVKSKNDGGVEIVMADKAAALDAIARHLGMFVDRSIDVTAMTDEDLQRLANSQAHAVKR